MYLPVTFGNAYLPQVDICSACNTSFSFDEEYVIALLSCILSDTTEPDAQVIPSVKRAFIRRSSLRAKLEASKRTNKKSDEERSVWQADLERVKSVILKNARGHVYYEVSETLLSKSEYINMAPVSLIK